MPREDRDKQPRPSEAHEHAYRPADGSEWTDPDPNTVGGALDVLRGILDDTMHAGVLDAISLSDAGGLDINWGAGRVYTPAGVVQATDASDGAQTCTDNAINYLIWAAGSGLTLQTTPADPLAEVSIGHIQAQDGDIWEIHAEPVIPDVVPGIQAGLGDLFPVMVASGIIVSEDADGTNAFDVAVSAGVYWHDAHDPHSVTQYDTRTADTLIRCYIDGSGPETWSFTDAQHSIDVGNWNSGTSLVGTSPAKWYRGMFIVSEDNVYWIYAQEQHNTLAAALAGNNPSTPAGIADFPTSIVYIYKHGDAAFDTAGSNRWIDIRPRINTAVPGSVTSHDSLADISADDHHPAFVAADLGITEFIVPRGEADGSLQDSAVWIDDNGKVGIGTASPDELLHVLSPADTDAVAKIEAPDGYKAVLRLYESVDYGFEFQYDGQQDKLHLWSRKFAGNEAIRMTWDKDGSIGIGNDSPSEVLDVTGNIKVSGTVDGVDVAAHHASTTEHGATGAVVGTTNAQTLTNKTLTDPVFDKTAGFDAVVAVTPGATATVDWGLGNMQSLTLGNDPTAIEFNDPPNPGTYHLKVIQNAGGSYVASWPHVDYWIDGGATPVVSTPPNAVDWFHFMWDGTNWYGWHSPNFA